MLTYVSVYAPSGHVGHSLVNKLQCRGFHRGPNRDAHLLSDASPPVSYNKTTDHAAVSTVAQVVMQASYQ